MVLDINVKGLLIFSNTVILPYFLWNCVGTDHNLIKMDVRKR